MRAPSRVFFARPAGIPWLLCWLGIAPLCAWGAISHTPGVSPLNNSLLRPNHAGLTRQSDTQQRLPGQTAPKRAALQGLVRGANGRAIVGATVTLRNLTSGQSFEKISNAQGVFRFIDILPGNYDLHVVATGFQDFTNSDLQLKPGDNLACEVTLIANPSAAAAQRQFPQLPAGAANPQEGSQPVPSAGAPPAALQNENLEQPGQTAPPESLPPASQVFQPEPDRWSIAMPDWDRYGIGGEHPYVRGSKWDPFNRNILKGDVPIIGKQTFLNFTATSDTFFDGRRLPTPTDVSSARPGSSRTFSARANRFFSIRPLRFLLIYFMAIHLSVRWTGAFASRLWSA